MKSLIKAGDRSPGLVITAFDRRMEEPAPVPAAAREDSHAAEIARLIALLADKDAEIAALGEAVAKGRLDGEVAGRLAAEQAFEDDRQSALDLLEAGIDGAQEALRDCVERAEMLALLLTRTVIDKLFGDGAERQRIVADLLRHQVAQIDRHSLVAVEVSRLDFPDTREVAGLAARLQLEPGAVRVDDEIDAGACRMRLKLGTLDVGLDRQWPAVRDLLDGLADTPDLAAE